MCAPCICRGHRVQKRESGPWELQSRWLGVTMWVMRTKPGPSAWATKCCKSLSNLSNPDSQDTLKGILDTKSRFYCKRNEMQSGDLFWNSRGKTQMAGCGWLCRAALTGIWLHLSVIKVSLEIRSVYYAYATVLIKYLQHYSKPEPSHS